MSRTVKRKPPRGRWSKEAIWYKRRRRKSVRRMTKQMLLKGHYDALPRYVGTEGWETW